MPRVNEPLGVLLAACHRCLQLRRNVPAMAAAASVADGESLDLLSSTADAAAAGVVSALSGVVQGVVAKLAQAESEVCFLS